jgi:hypothetical protein
MRPTVFEPLTAHSHNDLQQLRRTVQRRVGLPCTREVRRGRLLRCLLRQVKAAMLNWQDNCSCAAPDTCSSPTPMTRVTMSVPLNTHS